MTMEIPYASRPRPDTGVTNASLGMWLFIASEIMLFGSLFSSYALLRTGAAAWPDQRATLNVAIASVNTGLLVLSSAAITWAAAALRRTAFERFRGAMAASMAFGLLFLLLKGVEYTGELREGLRPSTNNFLGLYFTMTGLHALHVLAGLGVNGYLWATGPRMWRTAPERFSSRVRTATLYWNFIDVIWITMFIVLYLL
jgi:cytochrome c oxidase subunit III